MAEINIDRMRGLSEPITPSKKTNHSNSALGSPPGRNTPGANGRHNPTSAVRTRVRGKTPPARTPIRIATAAAAAANAAALSSPRANIMVKRELPTENILIKKELFEEEEEEAATTTTAHPGRYQNYREICCALSMWYCVLLAVDAAVWGQRISAQFAAEAEANRLSLEAVSLALQRSGLMLFLALLSSLNFLLTFDLAYLPAFLQRTSCFIVGLQSKLLQKGTFLRGEGVQVVCSTCGLLTSIGWATERTFLTPLWLAIFLCVIATAAVQLTYMTLTTLLSCLCQRRGSKIQKAA